MKTRQSSSRLCEEQRFWLSATVSGLQQHAHTAQLLEQHVLYCILCFHKLIIHKKCAHVKFSILMYSVEYSLSVS